jgi:hypothetical protein
MEMPPMANIFNYPESRRARDEGMIRVAEHNETFAIQFAKYIDRLPRGWTGTCEDIRKVWKGILPNHHNAWGSCWGAAKRAGKLVELEQQVSMTAVKAHARKTHLFRKV